MIPQGVFEQFGTQVLGADFNTVKQSRLVAIHSSTLAARRGAHEKKGMCVPNRRRWRATLLSPEQNIKVEDFVRPHSNTAQAVLTMSREAIR